MALLSTPVTLQPSEERYACWSFRASSDAAVVGVVGRLPAIALDHYAVLVSDDPMPAAPNDYECRTLSGAAALVSGQGGDAPTLSVPTGVALPLPAGQHIVLQLHLVNSSTSAVTVPPASLALTTSSEPGLTHAGLVVVRASAGSIAARASATATTACAAPMAMPNVFAAYASTSALGTRAELGAERPGGTPTADLVDHVATLGDDAVRPASATIEVGYPISLRCMFANRDAVATPADGASCIGILFYYPATTLRTECGRSD